LGITATTRRIADYFEENYFAHGHTYEAHPLAMAPVPAVIQEYKRLNILENVRKQGAYLGKRLNEIKEKHVSVGDIRGIGLFWAVELAKNRKTKKPFNTGPEKFTGQTLMVDRVAAELFNRGVYLMAWINHFIIAPPLIVTKEQVDQGVDALDDALKIVDGEVDQ
jgi:taurine--2-oxoglutarate transaminase